MKQTTEIVFPKTNELEFIAMGKKLGVKTLIFCYKENSKERIKKLKEKIKKINTDNVGIKIDLLILSKDRRTKDIVKTIVQAADNIQQIAEKIAPTYLYDIEQELSADFMHARRSNMNQVICRIAKRKKIVLGINMSKILNLGRFKRAKLLGRIAQNLKLYKKFGNEYVIGAFSSNPYHMRAAKEKESLLRSLLY